MDFFEAQARAKQRTSRLVVLFAFAVVGTVAAGYLAAVLILSQVGGDSGRRRHRSYYAYEQAPQPTFSLWQPKVFVTVSFATLAAIGLASLYKWNEYSAGGSAVAESVGGRQVKSNTTDLHERRLLNVVEEMAIASGIPMPTVYVLDEEPAINAFAAGLTTSDAVVAVTRGTMEKLSRDELQGVIGHEFSHILNGDMRLNLRLTALIFGILALGLAGRGILWALGRGRFRGGKNSGGAILVIVAVGVALLVIGYVGYFFGRLIQAAVSRQREFLADASAVQFTRNPGGITGALKKIGGYALGSSLANHQSAAIGHFFFAQGFESAFGGLWATHPPLDERIRAIDPNFDGQMFNPPEVVDVKRETFAQAGFAPGSVHQRPPTPSPAALVASIGTLTPEHIASAESLLAGVPDRVRRAARSPAEAPVLLYGLLLDGSEPLRAQQRALIASRAGGDALHVLAEIEPGLRALGPQHRLPLVQLALPAMRQVPPAALSTVLGLLDDLVLADGRVSTFEFALQKLLTRTLALGRTPTSGVVQIYSFNAVASEIGIVLSAVAHAAGNSDLTPADAFAAGAEELKLLQGRLQLLPAEQCDVVKLDTALEKLATASGPIKQRTLLAAAYVAGADGQLLVAESELVRAISAALDCPMPTFAAAA